MVWPEVVVDEPQTRNNADSQERTQVFALIFMAIVGAAVLMLLPVIIGAITISLGFSSAQIGFVGGADMLGAAIAAFFVGQTLRRISWHKLAFASIALIVLANLATAYSASFPLVIFLRLIAGACEGVLLSIGNTGLANSSRPDRSIAIYLVTALLAGAIGIQLFSTIAADHGAFGIFVGLSISSLLALPVVRWLPQRSSISERTTPSSMQGEKLTISSFQSKAPMIGVAGVLLYFTSLGLVWGNMTLIGNEAELTGGAIDKALSLSLIFGMIGGICAMILEARIGRLLPVCLSIGLSIVALVFMFKMTAIIFFAASAVLIFGWNFTYPYQVAAVAAVDATGSYVSKCVSMQLLGFSAGPLIAGVLLSQPNGYSLLKGLAIFGFTLSLALLIPVLRTAHD